MIECTMTTVKKRTTTKKHRHQQACEQVIVPAVGIGTINEGGNPVSSGATFGTRCRKNEDLMVPPPKLSWSSKPTSSSSFNDLALESNKHSIIMAPENNEREVTTNGRRSDRLSKSNNRTIAIGSTSLKINVQVNSFINENFSPLCVKKKASGSTSIKKKRVHSVILTPHILANAMTVSIHWEFPRLRIVRRDKLRITCHQQLFNEWMHISDSWFAFAKDLSFLRRLDIRSV